MLILNGIRQNAGGSVSTVTVVKSDTATLTIAETTWTTISNYGQSAEMTLTIPSAFDGLMFALTIGTPGYAIHIKPGSEDKIYLDGIALDNGDKISLLTPTVGDSIHVMAFQTEAAAYDLIATSGIGAWIDGGP